MMQLVLTMLISVPQHTHHLPACCLQAVHVESLEEVRKKEKKLATAAPNPAPVHHKPKRKTGVAQPQSSGPAR